MRYRKYSSYLTEKYGEKVYKIPVNLPGTCPNRDGTCGYGGCIFCGEQGAGFEALPDTMPVAEQLRENIKLIAPKYKSEKYIAYFQNFSGTYMPLEAFKRAIEEAKIEGVIGISVSTRPDCIDQPYLDYLAEVQAEGYAIEIELGLQSININTLNMIHRGHGLAEFVKAVLDIQRYGFSICVHLIANLPWDTEDDFYEAGRLISVLGIEAVKVHSLYILPETVLGQWYSMDYFDVLPAEAYIDRVIHFLRVIRPDIVVQRLFARAPEEALFCNWETSWRKLLNTLEERMETMDYKQGDLYNVGPKIPVQIEK